MSKYKATGLIAEEFDRKGIKYRIVSGGRQESVDAGFSIDNGPSVVVHFVSTDDDNDVGVRLYGVLRGVTENKRDAIRRVCNNNNDRFRFVKFVLDDDGDVSVQYDIPVACPDEAVGMLCVEVFIRIMKIMDDAYPSFMGALWGTSN